MMPPTMAERRPPNPPAGEDAGATVSTEPTTRTRQPPPEARLVIVYPRALAAVHPLTGAGATIGRQLGAGTTLAVDHGTVSRTHAEIRWDASAGRHTVLDLRSRNGTRLDRKPAVALPKFMADGAVLRLGDVLAVYEAGLATDDAPAVSRDALPGRSLAARRLRADVMRAAGERSPVLILGETGVGKESVAGELHRLSGRRGPLVAVNCAALSPQLFESQLFGHVRGAFTGATQEHAGLFRAAAGGTLFLDELGELPLDFQPKLLRAVELGEVIAVGGTQRVGVDVRVIAATNRALEHDVEHGKFRRDLHARLARCEIGVPPLRARRADLIDWLDRFHRVRCEQHGPSAALDFEVDAVEALLLAAWPDNLRGLQRLVQAVAPSGGRIVCDALPRWATAVDDEPSEPVAGERPVGGLAGKSLLRARPTRDELVAALADHKWSLRATAKFYGRDRKQIVRWVDMYAIEIPWRNED
jgi:transcriptional regulator with GAF, ATPase, and Fis domain